MLFVLKEILHYKNLIKMYLNWKTKHGREQKFWTENNTSYFLSELSGIKMPSNKCILLLQTKYDRLSK